MTYKSYMERFGGNPTAQPTIFFSSSAVSATLTSPPSRPQRTIVLQNGPTYVGSPPASFFPLTVAVKRSDTIFSIEKEAASLRTVGESFRERLLRRFELRDTL